MTLSLKYFLIGLTSLLLFTSCIDYEDVKFEGIEDYSFDKVNTSEVQMTFKMKVKNPNKYNIKVKKSNFDLFLNGDKLGTTRMMQDIKLKKNSTEVHSLIFESDLASMSKGFFANLGTLFGGTSKLRIKGEIKAKAYGVGKRFKVDFTHDIKAGDLKL